MSTKPTQTNAATSRKAEEAYLQQTLAVVEDNLSHYGREVARMQEDIDEMLAHYHDNDVEVLTILNNTVTLHDHMKRAMPNIQIINALCLDFQKKPVIRRGCILLQRKVLLFI